MPPPVRVKGDVLLLRYLKPTALGLPQGLPFEEWARLGQVLGRLTRATAWYVGDWLAWGEDHFGERYAQAMDATGHPVETLANWASVARKIPPSRRRESLPWSFHAEVVALPPAEQDQWLLRAERAGWTRSQFREALGKGRKALDRPHPPHTCTQCPATWNGDPDGADER